MKPIQKWIKYAALFLAVCLIIGIASTVLRLLGILSFAVGGSDRDVSEHLETVSVSGEFRSVDLELATTSLTVRSGEAFKIETNYQRLDFEVENGVLSVEEEDGFVLHFGNTVEHLLILTVPTDFVFEQFELSTGAGVVDIETLSAERISFELGAGKVRIDSLSATQSAEIDGGAGKIEILDGSIASLDLEMGAGELILRAALAGNSSIDCGVGSTSLTLLGAESDYTVRVSKGIGEVRYQGRTIGSGETIGNGSRLVSVNGGIGAIRIQIEAIP